jgi:hypothetical protein
MGGRQEWQNRQPEFAQLLILQSREAVKWQK